MVLLPLCGALPGGTIFMNTYITTQEETLWMLNCFVLIMGIFFQMLRHHPKLASFQTKNLQGKLSELACELASLPIGTCFAKELETNSMWRYLLKIYTVFMQGDSSLARTRTPSTYLAAHIPIVELTAGLVILSQHTLLQWPLHCSL